jgi:hypothetical protein
MNGEERWEVITYGQWLIDQHGPISTHALIEAGGKVLKAVGISNRLVIRMPNGDLFEEGLAHDRACYKNWKASPDTNLSKTYLQWEIFDPDYGAHGQWQRNGQQWTLAERPIVDRLMGHFAQYDCRIVQITETIVEVTEHAPITKPA